MSKPVVYRIANPLSIDRTIERAVKECGKPDSWVLDPATATTNMAIRLSRKISSRRWRTYAVIILHSEALFEPTDKALRSVMGWAA